MQPDAFELIRGVRTLLLESILPQTTAPHLKMQVGLAIGMLDSAARELDDQPNIAAERQRVRSLTVAFEEALGEAGIDDADSITALDIAREGTQPREDSATQPVRDPAIDSTRLLAAMDALCLLVEKHGGASPRLAELARDVDAALREQVARRASWGNPGPP